ncbi:Protein phosphatase 2C 6 [Rhizina undulata]
MSTSPKGSRLTKAPNGAYVARFSKFSAMHRITGRPIQGRLWQFPSLPNAQKATPHFIEDITTHKAPEIKFGSSLPIRFAPRDTPFRSPVQRPSSSLPSALGKRWFRDYFTAHLSGTSLHPDSAIPSNISEKDSKDRSQSDEAAAGRTKTVVRIPLRSAKHHFGAALMRGNRPHNEDCYQAGVIDLPSFAPPVSADMKFQKPDSIQDATGSGSSVFYFGVFDGHGGEECSKFLQDHFHRYIEETAKSFGVTASLPSTQAAESAPLKSETDLREARITLQENLVNSWKETVGGYFRRFKPDFGSRTGCGTTGDGSVEAVLTYAFLKADLDFITKTKPWFINDATGDEMQKIGLLKTGIKGGSTASIALISTPSSMPFWNSSTSVTLMTAHIGDTRILLCNTKTGLAVPLTTNHHPSSPLETRRLRRYATAFVSDSFGEERFGILANTRSFGDVNQKRLGVSAEPEIVKREIGGDEFSFMVLVSDGVSATLTDQEIVDIVKECKTPDEASKELVEFAEEVTTEGDNATALVVRMGGWEQRAAGGEGWMGTKNLRAWRRDEAVNSVRGRRM